MNEDNESFEKTIGLSTDTHSRKKRWLWGAVSLILLTGSVLWFQLSSEDKEVRYSMQSASLRDITISVLATGNLEPTNTVDVGIEVSGTITDVFADFNDRVKKDQVLAKIDTTKLESQVRNAKAALAVAKAELKNVNVLLKDARNERDRANSLFKSTKGNYPSDKEIDAAQTDFESAEASYDGKKALVQQANATLQSAEDDLRKAVVRSPMNGIILERSIEVGQTVVSSMETPVLFTIAENLTKMELSVSVDEADIGKVKEAQEVTFTVDAYPKKVFKGVIVQVQYNSEMVDGVVTYNAIVEVNNDDLLLRPGMTATAEIQTQTYYKVLTVPNAALRFSPQTRPQMPSVAHESKTAESEKVWVLKENQPVAVAVQTGASDGQFTIILEGLSKGEQVITGSE